MEARHHWLLDSPVPGWLGTLGVLIASSFWTYWGGLELFHEAWWGPWGLRALYLGPAAACLVLTVLQQAFPRVGGVVTAVLGAAFTVWWTSMRLARGGTWTNILLAMPFSGALVLVGALFYVEGIRRARGGAVSRWRWAVSLAPPLLVALVIFAVRAPLVLTRVDDGDYGERRIVGNGVDLVWAGEGPGWSPGLDPDDVFGPVSTEEAPTWADATAACAALPPQGTWRLPTSDELVRSLVRGGADAGCTPNEGLVDATCDRLPEKETPLWRPQASPIYLWAADEDGPNARYVSFNGWVRQQPKAWGNSRHGYRCVREP